MIEPMRRRHLREILVIEHQVYPKPWTPGIFQSELDLVRDGQRYYVVARNGLSIVGYSGLLFVDSDAHVTNIAVDPKRQRRHIGARILLHQARAAADRGCLNLTLEVRTSNAAAQALYRRFGFAPVGIRKNYYEGIEDAIVMWCSDIHTHEYTQRLRDLEDALGN